MAVRFKDVTIADETFAVPVSGFASEDTLRDLVDAIGTSKGNKGRADPSGAGGVAGSIKKTGKEAEKVSNRVPQWKIRLVKESLKYEI